MLVIFRSVVVLMLVVSACAFAEDEPRFQPEEVIHPLLKTLPEPDFYPQLGNIEMGVLTSSVEAKKHVLQGVALINATWDFEAYRHFCEAIKEDPDCLMAYWGASIALGSGLPEFQKQWSAASSIMLDLMARKTEDGEFFYPEYERDHAACAGVLLTEGARQASPLYNQMWTKYNNDLQSGLMSALLIKNGYDEFGDARIGQQAAEQLIDEILKKHPENPSALSTFLLIHSEAPAKGGGLAEKVLPVARQLTHLTEGFGTFLQLRAFFEWRTGNHSFCGDVAEEAEQFFMAYMDKHGLTVADCEKWIIARIFLCVSLAQQDKFDEAIGLAKKLALTSVEPVRASSVGGVLWLWDGRTLATRLLLARGQKGDIKNAMAALPSDVQQKPYDGLTLSSEFIKALRIYGERRRLISVSVLEKDEALSKKQQEIMLKLSERRDEAQAARALSEWYRSIRALAIWDFEARGLGAMKRPAGQRKGAYNLFSSANDRQAPANLSRIPLILYPLEQRLVEFFQAQGEHEKAAEQAERALEVFPKHLPTLRLYETSLRKLGQERKAKVVELQIKHVKGPSD